MVEAAFASRASTLSTRQNEAAKDMEGTDTEGTVSPGEVYVSKKVWISEEYKQADAELKGTYIKTSNGQVCGELCAYGKMVYRKYSCHFLRLGSCTLMRLRCVRRN